MLHRRLRLPAPVVPLPVTTLLPTLVPLVAPTPLDTEAPPAPPLPTAEAPPVPPPHVDPQAATASLTHCDFQTPLQQYGSSAQTAVTHASHPSASAVPTTQGECAQVGAPELVVPLLTATPPVPVVAVPPPPPAPPSVPASGAPQPGMGVHTPSAVAPWDFEQVLQGPGHAESQQTKSGQKPL